MRVVSVSDADLRTKLQVQLASDLPLTFLSPLLVLSPHLPSTYWFRSDSVIFTRRADHDAEPHGRRTQRQTRHHTHTRAGAALPTQSRSPEIQRGRASASVLSAPRAGPGEGERGQGRESSGDSERPMDMRERAGSMHLNDVVYTSRGPSQQPVPGPLQR